MPSNEREETVLAPELIVEIARLGHPVCIKDQEVILPELGDPRETFARLELQHGGARSRGAQVPEPPFLSRPSPLTP